MDFFFNDRTRLNPVVNLSIVPVGLSARTSGGSAFDLRESFFSTFLEPPTR